jgi:hypothetical protein
VAGDGAGRKSAKVAQVRDILKPLRVQRCQGHRALTAFGRQSVRVEAQVAEDPSSHGLEGACEYGKVPEAGVEFVSNGAGGTSPSPEEGLHAHPRGRDRSDEREGAKGVDVASTVAEVTVKVETLPTSPVQAVAAALAKYSNATANDVNISTVGSTWGHEVSRKRCKPCSSSFLLLAAYLTRALRMKNGHVGHCRGAPRHHLHDRHVRAVPIPSHAPRRSPRS